MRSKRNELLVASAFMMLLSGCVGKPKEPALSSRTAAKGTECSKPATVPDLQSLRLPGDWLTKQISASLGSEWFSRYEFFVIDHNFMIVFGSRNSNLRSSLQATNFLRSKGWTDCADAASDVAGVKFFEGYQVVARILDPDEYYGRSIFRPADSIQLRFTVYSYRVERDRVLSKVSRPVP